MKGKGARRLGVGAAMNGNAVMGTAQLKAYYCRRRCVCSCVRMENYVAHITCLQPFVLSHVGTIASDQVKGLAQEGHSGKTNTVSSLRHKDGVT